jgi:hypothetical protein
MDERQLARRLVQTFGAFDDLNASRDLVGAGDISPLVVERWDEWGFAKWRPIEDRTPREALTALYNVVPGPLAPTYEELVLSYRWYEVDVGPLRLLKNLGPGLLGLIEAITRDQKLFTTLRAAGFVQFGKGPDVDYDPVCFDLSRKAPNADCPIVKFDHEQILQNGRLVQVAELAPSFRILVERLVADGERELAARVPPES